jgi:pimeloyl-ACP methyl ester carboxylesterase
MRTHRFDSTDNIGISARFYSRSAGVSDNTCIIVAPGFAQHSGTRTMTEICRGLSTHADVLCLDFRGTGASGGRFHFGTHEYKDLEAPLLWARGLYSRIFLLGLSLGAYHSLRAAARFPGMMDHLLLISCPTKVEDICSSGAVARYALSLPFHRSSLTRDRQLLFRWAFPFSGKPDAMAAIQGLNIPISFLVGTRDLLVPPGMSRKVYEAYASDRKAWLALEGGHHADDLFSSHASAIDAWVAHSIAKVPG